jgi:hypothetical protein
MSNTLQHSSLRQQAANSWGETRTPDLTIMSHGGSAPPCTIERAALIDVNGDRMPRNTHRRPARACTARRISSQCVAPFGGLAA